MTSPISGASSATAPAATTSTTTSALGSNKLDQDTFLKLLVAQLKYQDPSKPADSTQFLAETAQFTAVDKLDALSKAQTQLFNSSQFQAATGLVGRSVSWNDGTADHTGTVASVTVKDGVPSLKVGDLDVTLDQITSVRAAGS